MCQIQTILIFWILFLVFLKIHLVWYLEEKKDCGGLNSEFARTFVLKILRFEIWKIDCEQHYKGLTQTHTRHIIHYSVQNCCLTNFGHCYFLLLLMNCLFKQDRWWFVGLKQTFGSSWRFPHNMGSWESYLQSLTILFSWTRRVQILGGRP